MKICLFNSDFPPAIGGISTYNKSIAYHLALHGEIGHVQVVAFENPEQGEETPSEKLSVVRVGRRSNTELFRSIIKYGNKFKGYDIFHTANLFPVGFFLVLVSKIFFRKPVILTVHGTDILTRGGSIKTKIARFLTLTFANHIIAVSESTRAHLLKKSMIDPVKVSVIYYPLPHKEIHTTNMKKEDLRAEYGLPSNDILVLVVATLVKRKGVDDLIKAIAPLPPHIKLIVIGDGPELLALQSLTEELNLSERVFFRGRSNDVNLYYQMADIFALTSFFIEEEGDIEGLGIVLLEAAQHALPVLGTRSGGIPEAIDEGKSGFIVEEHDISAMSEKIKWLAYYKNMREEMGKRGQEFVKEKFGWEKSIDAHVALYERILDL